MDTGRTYLFKDGKVIYINLTMSNDEIQKACEEVKGHEVIPLVSSEERNLNPNVNIVNNNILEIYKPYIDIGYSIIRQVKIFDVDYDKTVATLAIKCDCVVALNISFEDAHNIQGVFELLEPKKAFEKGCLYNIHKNMFDEIDHDYYDPCQNRGLLSSQVLPYFLKEKTNSLSDEEKKVVKYYRDFNLERLLTEDLSSYKLNNDNSGVMIITIDNMYVSTCKKMEHKLEVDTILKHLRPDLGENLTIIECTDESRSVIIQVCKGELIIWLPKYMKNYQISQLKSIIDIVKQINTKLSDPIIISAIECFNDNLLTIIRNDFMSSQEEIEKSLNILNEFLDSSMKNNVVKGSKIL